MVICNALLKNLNRLVKQEFFKDSRQSQMKHESPMTLVGKKGL